MRKFIIKENVDDTITKIILNRPEKRNALSIELLEELLDTIQECNDDPNTRVMILAGNGPIFCAGLDLTEATEAPKIDRSTHLIAEALSVLQHSPKVSIAAVQGAAIAGGAGLMTACDLAIATSNTKLAYPETRIGLVAAIVMPLLIRRIRYGDLTELLLVGDPIDANKALDIGLINRVVVDGTLIAAAIEWAERICMGGPNATRLTKELMLELLPMPYQEALKIATKYHQEGRHSSEGAIGTRAFAERRQPVWKDEVTSR